MLGRAHVTVVVPAFREAQRIARVLRTMPPSVDAILVVDDASDDGTADAARSEADRSGDGRVVVVEHAVNRGVGAAIVTGYVHALTHVGPGAGAGVDAFVVMAGDGQMDPRDLPAVVAPVAEGVADYVKGNRFLDASVDVAMPLGRRVGAAVFGALTSLAVGASLGDSQCGYTAISRSACATLDLAGLYPRYGYPNDLLGQLGSRRLRIREAPVRAVYAGEASGLRLKHLPGIAYLIGRAAYRRHAG